MSRTSIHGSISRSRAKNGALLSGTKSRQRGLEERIVWKSKKLVTFEQYLDRFMGAPEHIELIKGVLVERMSAQIEHELLQTWLLALLKLHVEDHSLGVVLGSRSAVKIEQFGGRLPDILFVSHNRLEIIEQRAIYGAPDLVIEIRSPGDRPSDIISLEADYRNFGVLEIWFIDPMSKAVRALRRDEDGYHEEIVDFGTIRSTAVKGFWLNVDWLEKDSQPAIRKTLETIESGPIL